MTKEILFTSIYKIYNSWRELTRGSIDFASGLRHSIPIVPHQESYQLQQGFNKAMDALKDIFNSISDTEELSDYNISHIYEDKKDDSGIRYEQTTLGLRKAICAEVYQLMCDNNIIWTGYNGSGEWWSIDEIFDFADSDSIIHACTRDTLTMILAENGEGFHITYADARLEQSESLSDYTDFTLDLR